MLFYAVRIIPSNAPSQSGRVKRQQIISRIRARHRRRRDDSLDLPDTVYTAVMTSHRIHSLSRLGLVGRRRTSAGVWE